MPTLLTTNAVGVYTQPNDVGQIPDGALLRADNAVVTRDGIVEQRRGMPAVASAPGVVNKAVPFQGGLVAQVGASGLAYSPSGGASWSTVAGSYTPITGLPMRSAIANQNLYFTTAAGIKRLDSSSNTPENAGIPSGLDMQATITSGTASAIPATSSVAYRIVWGKRDANNNLLLGPPSGRIVVSNTNATAYDANITFSIPKVIPSNAFFQAYRTAATAAVGGVYGDPGDECGLIYQGTPPASVAITSLARAGSTVTATGATNYYSAGQVVSLPVTVTVAGVIDAIGLSTVGASTPDGVTWTSHAPPAGDYYGVAWNGTVFAAVGNAVAASSPDGTTWTARTIGAVSRWTAVQWNGSLFAAVATTGNISTSPDGITWTSRGIPGSGFSLSSIDWNGSVFAAVGGGGSALTSPDGITWTQRSSASGATWFSVVWAGTKFVAVDNGGHASTSPDGITWTLQTASGNYIAVAYNGTSVVGVGSNAAGTSPDGITWTARTIPTGVYNSVTWTGSQFVAVGASVAATSPDGVTWTARSIPAGTYQSVVNSGSQFPAGPKTVVTGGGSAGASTFTYTESGSAGTATTAQTVTPVTGAFTDSTPSAFIGTALYTNPSQNGIGAAQYMVGTARDLAVFRQTLLFANVTTLSSSDVYLLGVSTGGSTTGLVQGNQIVIDGLAYTAGTSENVGTRTFLLSTGGTPAQNILATAQSLIRVINRYTGNTITALDASAPTDPPGHIFLQEQTPASSISVTFSYTSPATSSNTSAWYVGTLATTTQQQNRLYYSQQLQPDAVPLTNYLNIGAADQSLRRAVPLRDSTILAKDDGMYRLTGNGPFNFQVDPLDLTVNIIGPETAVSLENTVFCLSHHGIVRVSDTGVTVISRPIEDQIIPLVTGAMLPVTTSLAFGVGYESFHKYILFLPTVSTDQVCTQAWVYDYFTEAWTRWLLAGQCGLVNPADDLMYVGFSSSILQERKSLTPADYADTSYPVTITASSGTSVTLASAAYVTPGSRLTQGTATGIVTAVNVNVLTMDRVSTWSSAAATSYSAFPFTVEWAPRVGVSGNTQTMPDPGALQHSREVDFYWRQVYFANATVAFSTDIYPTGDTLALLGTSYGLADPPVGPFNLRTWVPQNEQRGTRLFATFFMQQAQCQAQLQGLAMVYEPGRERTSK